ncbi:pentapeptide repeat-containing protein [Aetokthonos hydrillicola Thurmond2011]|jgi:hypothetical protein|uniref:Pentapeptide repeat-containing protein n=1 Tax=Aetokthonos hydrillicola Thurmond2011 TaxID=2712845 RepID=A0AAP5M9J7_9CYAN|nr:pentapeptide repeat-containing protein [Aetokthonos hydrillicola]MBO3463274.1 pentapeptide repeat-containing protein [Aetokthonos hydrillicola CCALA 1050]MBW4589765.1 pentapeptide repeat-containing protein [Aetokthonos hydrillicola CCALA 1050]MDR9900261.1 pentapeptide repeat-containing protein [Aetokthonos hydrillicola Thurmond2011]
MPADYSGQNLRGRNFRGKNLEGANFSSSDIRSADFSGANLRGANFSHAKAGLQRRWAILLVLVSWVLMGLAGFLAAFANALIALLVLMKQPNDQIAYQIVGWTVIVIIFGFFFVIIRQGIQAGLGAGAGAFVGVGVGVGAFFGAAIVALGEAGGYNPVARDVFLYVTFAVAVAVVLFSTYTSWRVLKGDPKHALISSIAIAFAAFRGTSFRSADLTDADSF